MGDQNPLRAVPMIGDSKSAHSCGDCSQQRKFTVQKELRSYGQMHQRAGRDWGVDLASRDKRVERDGRERW